MPNALRTEGSPPAAPRAAGRTARPGTSQGAPAPGQRWPAFALLVVAYFITIVDFTIVCAHRRHRTRRRRRFGSAQHLAEPRRRDRRGRRLVHR